MYIDLLKSAGHAEGLCHAVGDGQFWLLERKGCYEAVVSRFSLFEQSAYQPPPEGSHVLRIGAPLLTAPPAAATQATSQTRRRSEALTTKDVPAPTKRRSEVLTTKDVPAPTKRRSETLMTKDVPARCG